MYYSLICPHVSTLTLHIYGVWFLLSQSLGWFMLGLTKGCVVLGRILVKLRSWWDLGKYIYNTYVHISFVHKCLIYNSLFLCWYVFSVDIVSKTTFLLSPQHRCPHFICPQTFNIQFFFCVHVFSHI